MAIDVEQLYRRYGPMVLRRCRGLLRDEALALDALQDTFVAVQRAQDRLDDRAPSAMLYQIATRVCLNHLRSQARRPETRDEALLMQIAVADHGPRQVEARSLLDRLFKRVPESTGAMAVMHWVDGMTLEEVAAATGMSVSGVRKRLRRLGAELRDLEDEQEKEPS